MEGYHTPHIVRKSLTAASAAQEPMIWGFSSHHRRCIGDHVDVDRRPLPTPCSVQRVRSAHGELAYCHQASIEGQEL